MIRKTVLLKQIDRWVGKGFVKVMGKFMGVTSGMSPPSKSEVKRILVIRPGGLGDAVLLAPMISAIRAHFEGALLHVLAEVRNGEVFLCDPFLGDRLFLYDRRFDLFKILGQSYDLIIDTEQSHYLSALVARMIRSKFRVGFGTNERRILFHCGVDYRQEDYEACSFLHLIEAVIGNEISFSPDLPFFPKFPSGNGIGSHYKFSDKKPFRILMAHGATIPERLWGWDKYQALAKRFLEKGMEVVLIGSKMDQREAEKISEGVSGPLMDKTGQTSIADLWKIICEGDLLISCDTGALHLAYGVGTPSVSLFGAGNEKKWAPKGKNYRCINKHLLCSPCSNFGETPPCPIGVACLETITVEEVEQAALELLGKG